MVLLESQKIELGTKAKDFKLPGIDGKIYTLDSFKDKKVLVIMFICVHCPYVKAVEDRLIKLCEEFKDRGVQFVGICSNDAENYPEDSFENMKKHAQEKGYNFPYLRDESQEVAKSYGAVCTPDIYVYDENRELVYHGRIDDNWQDESKVTRRDLRDAIVALLEGRKPSKEQYPSMGCSIKWKSQ